ncbi:mannose-6-phosphate isomerase, class I [Clostridium sp. AM58-1XD]|uniref:mannose-6-phosphate isomerase, class I n=1 Tax=Clostridium sp. AM58-1XD TaxID=2292307 RepID=UPI000E5193E2|nr:mannose-6-phosphate isomerase, class I [Clostridium sp. AM58-1XD]RGZ01165.1 mannose-6-phosphate isomerase, class I [Clostridium sp. AM58-1XD]
MKEIIFLEPVFKQNIWGGHRMREEFRYDIPWNNTGEAWVVSAHPNGDCRIRSGTYEGKTLSWLWDHQRSLFGNLQKDEFPLLVKIIDAADDLSIQVHPDDSYARSHENQPLGKTECWYILDCMDDASIVIGHNAQTKQQLKEMIDEGKWPEIIRTRPIKQGDFFFIEPGTVHAIKAGTMILEIQQNSDITYRLYDYERLYSGAPRELHIQQSLDVITCPHREFQPEPAHTIGRGFVKKILVSCPLFTVEKWSVKNRCRIPQPYPFLIVDVLDGIGTADSREIKKGDHFILPAGYGDCRIWGNLTLVTSHL